MADREGMGLPPHEGRKGGSEGSTRGRRLPRARRQLAQERAENPIKVRVYVLKVKTAE